jgi:hypothetical protein
LSPANRCRLHEELGGLRKPLTCRMFPYRFHPVAEDVLVTTSFCCPTTIGNSGEPLPAQLKEITALRAEWFAVYPEQPRAVEYVKGRTLDESSLRALREVLRQMLERTDADGKRSLRANALRMARTLEDLARYRVVRLADEAFAEYLRLTGRYAAATDKPVEPRRPSALGRVLRRGFLFVVAATRLQVENSRASGLKLGLRLRLLRLLAHFHGLLPGVSGSDLRAARRVRVDVDAPELQEVAYHYLRSSIAGLGSGRKPVVDELALAFSYLNAACDLCAMKAAETGQPVDAALFSEALMEAVDLTHADERGLLGGIVGTLAGGPEALYAFAAR